MVAEGHDVLFLVVFPLEEGLAGTVHVKRRIVGFRDQLLHIVALIVDGVMGIAIMGIGAMIANKANAVAAVAGIITADKLNF